MRSVLKYLGAYKKECVLSPLFKLLEASFELIVPLVVAALIDRGIAEGNTPYILRSGLILILLGAAGLAFALTAQFFAARAAAGFAAGLRLALFKKIQKMDYSSLDSLGTDTLITRMTSDVSQVQNGVNMFLRLLLRSPFIVAGAAIMAFTVDHGEAFLFLLLLLLLSLVIITIMKITAPAYRKVQERLDFITRRTRENLTGVRVIRAFCREREEAEDFERENTGYTDAAERAGRISSLMNPLTLVLVNLFTALLIYTGAVRVDTGILSRGALVALLNYMAQILVELIKLANLVVLISRAVASGERIGEILDRELPGDAGKIPFPESSSGGDLVEFKNVSFVYRGSQETSLSDISFSVKKGDSIGVIGGTGSGKTSLINLIPAFYEATEGEVLINGKDVREIDKRSLRDRIGIVPQKAELFRGTVRQNLCWGKPDANDGELWEALEKAQAADFIREKKEGLDLIIEQGGRNLSGGQKQRLTIARALVKKPEILILDDSASALDYATDAALRMAIREEAGKMTLFTVSQRTVSVRDADLIIVLDDGKIAGKGSHEELLRDCGIYREIYYSQFPDGEA